MTLNHAAVWKLMYRKAPICLIGLLIYLLYIFKAKIKTRSERLIIFSREKFCFGMSQSHDFNLNLHSKISWQAIGQEISSTVDFWSTCNLLSCTFMKISGRYWIINSELAKREYHRLKFITWAVLPLRDTVPLIWYSYLVPTVNLLFNSTMFQTYLCFQQTLQIYKCNTSYGQSIRPIMT